MIIDSNIIIYSVIPENSLIREYLKESEENLAVSSISKLEVLGYHNLNLHEKELLEKFFDSIIIYSINDVVIDKAILIRQTKNISVGDSIIAATAISHQEELFTNNDEDFVGIPDLKIIYLKSVLQK